MAPIYTALDFTHSKAETPHDLSSGEAVLNIVSR